MTTLGMNDELLKSSFWYPEFGGRIRTFEGVSRQIYSLIPLAARETLQKTRVNFALYRYLCQSQMNSIYLEFIK